MEVEMFDTRIASVWLAHEGRSDVVYHYGGTRLVDARCSDEEADATVRSLASFESAIKNRLINIAVGRLSVASVPGLHSSRVGGGRCVIRAKTNEFDLILRDPANPSFTAIADELFATIGSRLNAMGGILKLTPDFGRFARVADILHRHTEHVLGIAREKGGCGGKSSYTATGVIAALDRLAPDTRQAVVVGAAGALGADVVRELRSRSVELAVADLAFTDAQPDILPSVPGKFSAECLERGGVVIATTIGNEFENSDLVRIPSGATFLLAHNNSLPVDREAAQMLAEQMIRRSIRIVPGQLLTFGGALTSRIEYLWRLSSPGRAFDKQLAHSVVRDSTRIIIDYLGELDGPTLVHALHRAVA
ncbi:MAG: hypothetical protein QM817_30280 [Archangium sp.]